MCYIVIQHRSFVQDFGVFLRFLRYCWPLLRKQHLLIAGSFIALFAQVGFQLLEPWPLAFVIDEVIVSRSEQSSFFSIELDAMTLITYSAIALVIIASLLALSAYFEKVGFALLGSRVLTEVRNRLYRHVQGLSLSYHTKASRGDLILRVMGDVSILREVSVTAFLPMLGNTLIMLGMLAVMFWLNWELALVGLITAPVFFFFALRLTRQIHHVALKQRKREGVMATTTTESIGAIKEVQALSISDTFLNAFSAESNKTFEQDVKARKLEAGLQRIVDVLVAVSTALVLWFGSTLVLSNELTLGELVIFMTYLSFSFKPVRNMAKYIGRLARASASCERVLDLLEQKPDVYDMQGAIKAPALRGDVRFDNVSFAYEPGHYVLENINFCVAAGQHVAILGSSGSGKSTMVNLILRLYDPTKGRVLIDERDIREYTLASFREQISLVLEENPLFPATVKDNIAYSAPNATLQEIEAAAHLANAHEFIQGLPDGYDTILGDGAATLSKGQRQRIAIARAALRKTPILILDEPTSGLDKQNEREIAEALKRLENGRTSFIVTHNPQEAACADLILYLEHGHVVESGSHEELMKVNGRYTALHRIHESMQANNQNRTVDVKSI
jgi:ATP-binding cassette, subfamily B, bacterial